MSRIIASILAAGAASWHFTLLHLSVQRWDAASLANAVAGQAIVPMQYRALIPWVVGAVQRLDFLGPQTWSINRWEFVIGIGSGMALWASVAVLVRASLQTRWGFATLSALLVFPVLPFHYVLTRANYYYCYDIASVAFFGFLLAKMCERRWWVYYPVFAIATLNRETTLFLIPVFLLTSVGVGRYRWLKWLIHAAVQLAIWTAIKLALWSVYSDNVDASYSGQFYKTEIARNTRGLLLDSGEILPNVLGSFALLWVPVLILYRSVQNKFLKRALLIVPLWYATMFYVGLFEEARIYGELLPLVLVAFVQLLRQAAIQPSADIREGLDGPRTGVWRS